MAGLVRRAADGNFYGTTQFGGANNAGTAFKTGTTVNSFSVVHSFNFTDGYQPVAGLFLSSDANFYGTTQLGGASSLGTVFKMTAAGAITTLHSFVLGDGQQRFPGLIQARDGLFYRTVFRGGANADGTAFNMNSTGTWLNRRHSPTCISLNSPAGAAPTNFITVQEARQATKEAFPHPLAWLVENSSFNAACIAGTAAPLATK